MKPRRRYLLALMASLALHLGVLTSPSWRVPIFDNLPSHETPVTIEARLMSPTRTDRFRRWLDRSRTRGDPSGRASADLAGRGEPCAGTSRASRGGRAGPGTGSRFGSRARAGSQPARRRLPKLPCRVACVFVTRSAWAKAALSLARRSRNCGMMALPTKCAAAPRPPAWPVCSSRCGWSMSRRATWWSVVCGRASFASSATRAARNRHVSTGRVHGSCFPTAATSRWSRGLRTCCRCSANCR